MASNERAALDTYLCSGVFVDSASPVVGEFTERALRGLWLNARARGVALYYAVRDGLKYDLYAMAMQKEDFVASNIVRRDSASCVPKAILLTAEARAAGIPARIGYADVRNHLCTPNMYAEIKNCHAGQRPVYLSWLCGDAFQQMYGDLGAMLSRLNGDFANQVKVQ